MIQSCSEDDVAQSVAAALAPPGGAEPAVIEHSAGLRQGRELLAATMPFAQESKPMSAWVVCSTFALAIGALSAAGLVRPWPVRVAFSMSGALLMVRAFITYHDFMHGAILRGSRWGSALFHLYGCFALTPPRSWRMSHNYNHGHVGQLSAVGIGAFPLISTHMWHEASRADRAKYRATHHPLIIVFGYVTVFLFSITLMSLLRDPKRYWDSGLALLAHGSLVALLLPMSVASMLGAYLFFA
jgi:acyl-lipid omega-6 desaturase (Delta-12 desaturase)